MNPSARAAYMDASVATASPARLLVMLYERLVLDCHRALEAQQAGDHPEAHRQLVHAQDIVMELRKQYRVQIPEEDYGHLASMQSTVSYLEPKMRDIAAT